MKNRRSRKLWSPALRFTPTAWAKLLYLRDRGDSEVGGFGISADDDLLLIEDVQLVQQVCSWAHVAFDDSAVADFFDRQVDAGRRPEQFGRIWVHTHPGACPRPSLTDEETFARVFGCADWAVMFILAREGSSYARLRYNLGPGAELILPVQTDYSRHFEGCTPAAWEQEHGRNVTTQSPAVSLRKSESGSPQILDPESHIDWFDSWIDPATDFDSFRRLY